MFIVFKIIVLNFAHVCHVVQPNYFQKGKANKLRGSSTIVYLSSRALGQAAEYAREQRYLTYNCVCDVNPFVLKLCAAP